MRLSRGSRIGLRVATGAVLAFIYIPIAVIIIYAFNENKTQRWPIDGLTLDWFDKALHNSGVRDALWTSLQAAVGATLIALLLGTLAAIAVSRYDFFGKNAISFLVIQPIALPGIVTGMALNATFTDALEPLGVDLGMLTIIIGHATFCVVVVYNNAAARMRRLSPSVGEASADLGATPWQTFAFVTLPQLRSALAAGGLLAFGLSFDEVIVTTFTAGGDETLPLWILTNLSRPNQLPIVNVVAFFVVLLSIIPVYFAHKLTSSSEEEGVTAAPALAG